MVYLKRDKGHKESCAKLIKKGVTTQEKMESLITHCKQVPFLAGKTLNLKNLVNELAGWLQLQRKATAAPSSSPVVSTIGNKTAELLASREAIKQRILQKEAEQGERQLSPLQRAAQKKQEAGAMPTEMPEEPDAKSETTNEEAQPVTAPASSSQPSTPARPLYGPKKDGAPTYTRIRFDKPSRPRTKEGRMQEQQRRADGGKEC